MNQLSIRARGGRASSPRPQSAVESMASFAVVGAIGFLIEAALITILTRGGDLEAWQARIPSFLTAVTTTWLLNRKFTFPGRGLTKRTAEVISYTAIQACGALINLVVFGICLAYSPQLETIPVIPLAFGAIGALCFNFVASKMLLYRKFRN